MVSKGLTGVALAHHSGQCAGIEPEISPDQQPSYPAQAGYPVPRGPSIQSLLSLDRPPQFAIAHKADDDG